MGSEKMSKSTNGIMIEYPSTVGLSWRDRLVRWSRWTIPVPKEAEKDCTVQNEEVECNNQESIPIAQSSPASQKDSPSETSSMPSTHSVYKVKNLSMLKSGSTAYWDSPDDFDLDTSAIMGHVLHCQPPEATAPLQESALSVNSIRSFSNAVPNISKLLTNAVNLGEVAREIVVMRFLPDPFSKAVPQCLHNHSTFPAVEVRFNVNSETRELFFHSVLAILSTEISDLMLPNSPTDIRFQQRSTAALHVARDNLPEGLSKFCEQSNLTLDFASNGGLTMPPSLTLPCPPFHPLWKNPSNEDTKNDPETPIDYLFTGLEIRKILPLRFEGWRLLYTSIEAGKAGGRRGELQLRPQRMKRTDDAGKTTEEAFMESAFRLADPSLTVAQARRVMQRMVSYQASNEYHGAEPLGRILKYAVKRPSDFELPDFEDDE